jgi:hypothetical protein
MNTQTDLLMLWAWEYDAEFVDLLARTCAARGVRMTAIDAAGMPSIAGRLEREELRAGVVIDRVWDWGEEYEAHVGTVDRLVPYKLNDYARVRGIWNKPHVHYLLMRHGIQVPYMHVLPAHDRQAHLEPSDLTALRGKFSIKAAHSGGSGVVPQSRNWEDVERRRLDWRNDETIIQEWIEPRLLGKRRAWFRIFYACGVAYICWQDDRTHIQQPVLPSEERQYGLENLRVLTAQIGGLCGLNLFSTEIALTTDNRWVVVDYVNDPCDYRPQSLVSNGVPDTVVRGVCDSIAMWVKRRLRIVVT